MPNSISKVDPRGRVSLGSQYANKHVQVVEAGPSELLLRFVTVVPEHEAWLFQNKAARESVAQGLEQAKGKEFAENPPDVNSALKWLEESAPDVN